MKIDSQNDQIIDNSLPPVNINDLNPITLKDLMNRNFPPIDWIVKQLIPTETITAISGIPSAYKTWLILDLALRVAKGELLFDKFETNQTGVLIIDEETGPRWIQQRILKLNKDFEFPVYLLSKTGFKLTDDSVKQILLFCKKENVKLVIFDSLLRIHTAKDENDAVEMAKVFKLFQQLTNRGLTVIFTHHNRKQSILKSSNPSQDMRGSSDISAAVDCHLAVERKEDYLIINQAKLRQAEEITPFKLNITSEENLLRFEYAGEIDEVKAKKEEIKIAIKDILEKTEQPLYQKELLEAIKNTGVEGGSSKFGQVIKEMLGKGEIFEIRGNEKNKIFYSLKPIK